MPKEAEMKQEAENEEQTTEIYRRGQKRRQPARKKESGEGLKSL